MKVNFSFSTLKILTYPINSFDVEIGDIFNLKLLKMHSLEGYV